MTDKPPTPVNRDIALRIAWAHIKMLPAIWRETAAGLRPQPTTDFAKGQASGLDIAADQLTDDLPRLTAAIQCAHGVLPGDTCPKGCW